MTEKVFNIYIDEAGDEGFKFDSRLGHGSSKFFVLSAIIVDDKIDRSLADIVTQLKVLFQYQEKDMHAPLHFVKMSHSKRKACIDKLVEFKDFTIVSVVCEKEKLFGQLQNPPFLYNFACRLLLERIIPFLKEHSAKANLYFEHRRNTSYDDLKVYIKKIVDTSLFLTLSPRTKTQLKCLQLADIVASSTYQSFELDNYGNIEPAYFTKLKNNLYVRNNKCLGYGLKLYPTNSNLIELEQYNWINEMLHSLK